MKPEILALGLGLGVILVTTQALHAEGTNCADRDLLVTRLAQDYGETRQSVGLAGTNQLVEVFASIETGTWTITITSPSGVACMVAAGALFERLDEALTPAMLGDPA